MQVKSVLFFIIVGAVAVVAKKGGSSEEIDGPGSQILDVWPYPRPYGSAPKPLKFKRPKHHPQYPAYFAPQPAQEMAPLVAHQFLENLKRKMEKVSISISTDFQLAEAEFNRRKINTEYNLVKQLQTIEQFTLRQNEGKINATNGGNSEEIQKCLKKPLEDVGAKIFENQKKTQKCIEETTDRVTRVVREGRNSFTEMYILNVAQMNTLTQEMYQCLERRDYTCAQEKIFLVNRKEEALMNEKNRTLEKLREAGREQENQLHSCQNKFFEMIQKRVMEFSAIVDVCVVQAKEEKTNKPVDSVESLDK